MKKLIACATAAFAFAALLSSVPAKADVNYGAVKNGSMCWKNAPARASDFGFWAACPATASAIVTPKHRTAKR